jgi:hypothetical protein
MRHVNLYSTQPLIPQCLALGLYFIERSSADFGFRVGTSLLLREERNSDTDDNLRWAPGKREERAGFHHVTNKAAREYKLRFAKSSRDEAVPMLPNFNYQPEAMREHIQTSPRSRRRIGLASVRRC